MILRFSLRQLMMTVLVLVAIMSLVCRGLYYQKRADWHKMEKEKVHDLLYYIAFSPAPRGFVQPPPPDIVEREVLRWDAFRDYHEQMRIQCEFAILRPWIVVAKTSGPNEPATLKAAIAEVKSVSRTPADGEAVR